LHPLVQCLKSDSRNRIDTLARILNILIDISTAISCAPVPSLAICPLPAKKMIWEARTAAAWEVEFNEGLRARQLFGLATDGQLMRLRFDYGGVSVAPANWEEWYAGTDSFGTLIMIAASVL
jgi:hypothetical protein